MTTKLFNGRHPFWSVRKLLICYHVLKHLSKEPLPLADIIYPFQYPKSLESNDWEAFRVFTCLTNLDDIGITIKKVHLDPFFYSLEDVGDQWELRTEFKPQEVLSIIQKPFTTMITPHGGGEFILGEAQISPKTRTLLAAPGFFRLKLDTSVRKLKKALASYTQRFKAGKLHAHNTFGYPFTKRLMEKFFKAMSFRQDQQFTFSPGLLTKDDDELIRDELTDLFKASFKYEYQLWREGGYDLRLFDYLIGLEFEEMITIEDFQSKADPLNPDTTSDELISRFGFNLAHLRTNLTIVHAEPKQKTSLPFFSQKISLIEVIPTDNSHYYVYLNREYKQPLMLNRQTKTGKLWYCLATEGYLPISEYRDTYRYVQTDKRSKFFAKTKYSFTQLLEVDQDGFIIPAPGITIRTKAPE